MARSKHRLTSSQAAGAIGQINAALDSNDVASAEAIASAYYQQATNAPALQPSDPTVIVDPLVAAETAELIRSSTAFEIARCFYNHAELDAAKQWATTATTGGTLAEQNVRLATVLLGNIASAMDKNDEAVADFTSVINLPNLNREQAAAYAGLLEVFMLQKQDDLVEQWVQQGRERFAESEFELDYLKKVGATLRRRNHPLWRELDQDIVGLSSAGPGNKLYALRQLASNARKFGRWTEAETDYAAICALGICSPQDTVNSYLFVAEAQAKQSKDFAPTLQTLQTKAAQLLDPEDREYASYRIGKFYEEHDNLDQAATSYQSLVTSLSTSTWVAASLHQLAGVKAKQGDPRTAIKLYLQYPQRFPQNARLNLQSYAGALNVAMTVGDTNAADQIAVAITNSAASLADYNAQLHLAFYFLQRGNKPMAREFLERGFAQVPHALALAPSAAERYRVHFNYLKHLSYFNLPRRTLEWLDANPADFPVTPATTDVLGLGCYAYKAFALNAMGKRDDAIALLQTLLDQVQGDSDQEIRFSECLAQFYDWAHDSASATELFEAMALKYPTHPWASFGRLNLAIHQFKAGDVAGALKLTEDIINSLPENSKRRWIRSVYWGAVYLRGCCLEAQGGDGNSLKQAALKQVPDLRIEQELRRR
ncbi:MAG TPA: tetratricopeptide repeat protein [Verrucomicrobiae bacterium]|nr:tetratricopeptide repeat protein [Verrucomicrobiae bacterium]